MVAHGRAATSPVPTRRSSNLVETDMVDFASGDEMFCCKNMVVLPFYPKEKLEFVPLAMTPCNEKSGCDK